MGCGQARGEALGWGVGAAQHRGAHGSWNRARHQQGPRNQEGPLNAHKKYCPLWTTRFWKFRKLPKSISSFYYGPYFYPSDLYKTWLSPHVLKKVVLKGGILFVCSFQLKINLHEVRGCWDWELHFQAVNSLFKVQAHSARELVVAVSSWRSDTTDQAEREGISGDTHSVECLWVQSSRWSSTTINYRKNVPRCIL